MTSPDATPELLPRTIDGPLVVIGDLHGAAPLLDRLLRVLAERVPDLADRWVVFAGDFIDRYRPRLGGNPRKTIDAVLALRDRHRRVAAVMGNHDLALLGATGLVPTPPEANGGLRYVATCDSWPTFASYGVSADEMEFDDLSSAATRLLPYFDPTDPRFAHGEVPSGLRGLRDDTLGRVAALVADLRERMPVRHRAFLAGLPWCVEHPRYLVVHAGLTDAPYAEQLQALRARDFQHMRPPWLHHRSLAKVPPPADCPVSVVSGHRVVPRVEFLHGDRRVLVDTFGGEPGRPLSAVLLPERMVVTSDG